MLQRSVLALSYRRLSIKRVPRQASTQISSSVYPRREFSSVPHQNVSPGPGSTGKPSDSGRHLPKVLVGSIAIGTCLISAYSKGYLDDILGKKQQSSTDPSEVSFDTISMEKLPKGGEGIHDSEDSREPIPVHTGEDMKSLGFHEELARESTSKDEGEKELPPENSENLKHTEEYTHGKEEELPKLSADIHAKGEDLRGSPPPREIADGQKLSEDSTDMKNSGQRLSEDGHGANENLPTFTEASTVLKGNQMDKDLQVELKSKDEPKDILGHAKEPSASLLDTYNLRDKDDERASSSLGVHDDKHSSAREETLPNAFGDINDAYLSKDGKLILDFLQAIHAAEQRQAELDARVFAEEKRAMKEKYEKELKDARARELMYAEEAAMLEKEVKKEQAKAAAALKSLQERSAERLKKELEEKEKEAEIKLRELQEFAKAELAASIAQEKAAQIENMAEANLNINALCMAFYARSEEARQSHSIHKLALGALALEDALSNGLPVQAELDALRLYIEGVDKDSLLQLALSSLPEDVRRCGTDSPLQLKQKFEALKGTLRHFTLIPPDGGGILAHSLAHVASFLKVKEGDRSGDGIESVINKVESLLAQGKLAEAADALEDGVKGSKAAEVASDWLTRARNRAITEQALVLLQSYATSVSLA